MPENNKESVDNNSAHSSRIRYPELRDELIKLVEEDQAERRNLGESPTQQEMTTLTKNDRQRTARVKEILKKIKKPSADNIGMDGSRAFWLLTQHSDITFMQQVLSLFEKLFNESPGSVYKKGIPYLHDRIQVMKDGRQTYGTQYFIDENNKERMFELAEPTKVNELRSKYGLEPLQDE